MSLDTPALDLDAIANDVCTLRRNASIRANRSHVELYAKLSRRVRVERRDDDREPSVHHVHESGMAARVWSASQPRAGFAAASGVSNRVADWVVDHAMLGDALASAAGLDPAVQPPGARWDVDPADDLPDEEALATALLTSTTLRWVEAGTTVEVLVGAEDRWAVRRRHRVWAQHSNDRSRLVAQRGFEGWRRLAESRSEDWPSGSGTGRSAPLLLTPDAGSPLVAALVASLHYGDAAAPTTSGGAGWTVADDPAHPAGLSGGLFDDAGYAATVRPLAENGRIVGRLGGPGTYRRSSFREPPLPAPSNLVVPAGDSRGTAPAAVDVLGCRVVRLGPRLWVLDLDLPAHRRAYVRVDPVSLVERCVGRIGPQQVTATGPIVPSLLFDRLDLIDRP